MDYCHCTKPKVVSGARGVGDFCQNCGMWYVEKEWKRDSRVTEAKKQEIVDAFSTAAFVESIIFTGEANEIARKEKHEKKISTKIKKLVRRMFGRN